MNTYRRNPEWTVIIKRPDYTRNTLLYKEVPEWSNNQIIRFVSSAKHLNGVNNYTDLISYEYENQINNPTGAFSLTFVPVQDKNGLTWKDKIRASDIVFISEFGKIRYIGIVRGSGYSMSFSGGKPSRKITITGESIGGRLQSFSVPMNTFLWLSYGVADIKVENEAFEKQMLAKMGEGQDLGKLFTLITEKYIAIALVGETYGIGAFLDEFLDLEVENLIAHYPFALKLFQRDSNTLWTMFRQVLPTPVYEIFGRYIDNKYKIICRETPFDKDTWDSLPITTLNSLYLIDQNLNDTDAEIYTQYCSLMPNSAYSQNENYADMKVDQVAVFDKEKLPIYGYRKLEANFPFFDLVAGRDSESRKYLKTNSRRMYAWYVNNVDFQSGEITMHTVKDQYINVGERIKYLQGADIQFYVEGIKRRMSYPGTMTTTYSVTRGYEYGTKTITIDGESVVTPQVKRISQLGKKLIETEKEIVINH